jgi:hypothetical protein
MPAIYAAVQHFTVGFLVKLFASVFHTGCVQERCSILESEVAKVGNLVG